MSHKWKRLGSAVQRTPKAEVGSQSGSTTMDQTYATSRELQTRYLRQRFGLNQRTAVLVAGLYFGEGK